MSPAERRTGAERILAAGLALGARAGVGALSLQAIAAEAGVSKALVLYHFTGKAALLDALLAAASRANAARLHAAARGSPHALGAMEAWRALLRDPAHQQESALVGALALEADVDPEGAREGRVMREDAATALATAILAEMALAPRIPAAAIGRLVLRQMDGLAAASCGGRMSSGALDAEIDTFALALMGLGR